MKAIIRKAESTDSKAILNLIKELALFENEPESVSLNVSDIQRYSTWKGPTFHLEDLIVSGKYKGNGIGTKLYSAFIQKSYEAGVERIEWNVLDWNSPAVNFYNNSGARVLKDWRTVQMHRYEMKNYLDSIEN